MTGDDVRDAFEDPEPFKYEPQLGESCPITPLGHAKGTYWVADAEGQVRSLTARQFTVAGVLDLFLGDRDWLTGNNGFKSEKPRKGDPGWDNVAVTAAIMADCRALGFFDEKRIRGAGVWRLDDKGSRLVYHAGDAVMVLAWPAPRAGGGPMAADLPTLMRVASEEPGQRIGDYVYAAEPPLPSVPDAELTVEQGAALLKFFERWNWSHPAYARAVLGWDAVSQIVGALQHRPTLYLIADQDHGKTELLQFMRLKNGGDTAVYYWDSTTAAGVRKAVGERRAALPVLIDEAEGKGFAGNDRILELIELARGTYTRGGGRSVRGGSDGNAVEVNAIIAMGAIAPPPIPPQDMTRMAILTLRPLKPTEAERATFESDKAKLLELGPALRRRMLAHWPLLAPTIAHYRAALTDNGLAGHALDTWATLLAGAHLVLHDAPCTAMQARDIARPYDDDLIARTTDSRREHELLWNQLMSTTADQWKGGGQVVVGEALWRVLYDNASADLYDIKRWGLSIVKARPEGAPEQQYVAVSNTSDGIKRLLKGSRFAGGGWATMFLRMPGAVRSEDVLPGRMVRFANGIRDYAVLVPAVYVDEGDRPAQGAPRPVGDME